MTAAGPPLRAPHVARPRLVAALRPARIAVIVGAGGYGKTTLALELAHELGIAWALTRLAPGDDDASAIVRRLRRALRAGGLSDAADTLEDADAPELALERLLNAFRRAHDPVLLVLDEIAHAGERGGAFVAELADGLPPGNRLVLAGRLLPASLAHLFEREDVATVRQPELVFTDEEAADLLARTGVAADDAFTRRFRGAGAGWPVALALAAERLWSAADPADDLEAIEAAPAPLDGLVEARLAALGGDERAAVLQVVHLPVLTRDVADAATGLSGLIDTALAAGLPFDVGSDGHVRLPDPVRDVMAGRARLSPAVATRAADAYAALGRGTDAIRLLVAIGDADGAAARAAALSPAEVSKLDVGELRALLTPISPVALDRHPRALMHLARVCEASADRVLRRELLERAARAGNGDSTLEREIEAERARDLVRDGRVDEAANVAERLLATAQPDEPQTRVRALHVLARTHAWRGDAESLAIAEPLLVEAAELYGRLGFQTARAHALLALAYDVYTLGGRYEAAVDALDRALVGLAGRSRLRGVVLVFRAEALIDLGRLTEAEVTLVEAERLGRIFGDTRTLGYTAWLRARAAAPFGDGDRVRTQLREAERHHGEWFEHHSGAEFLAEAALLLGQVGDIALSRQYLARALRREDEAPRYVRLAVGATEARHGDPARAEEILAAVAVMPDLETRERWRVALLRAGAAQRSGDEVGAAVFARDAFSAAECLGVADLPLRREAAIATALLPLLEGSVRDRMPTAAPMSIAVLGGFAVRRGEARLVLPAGRPTALVKLLTLRGGRLPTEEVIETLWPGVDPPSGRKRLRNVLNRLRVAMGEIVVRDGDLLALAGVEVDARLFEQKALAALAEPLAPGAGDGARAALALYQGDALPDDPYEDWAAEPRERLRARALSLLDLLAARAEEDGQIDEALRLLDRGLALDRLDETRYVRSAGLLLRQGRRGRALEVLRAGAASVRELGLEPSEQHRALVRAARG